MKDLPIVIITGLSGSGKSTVMNALEDIGFFCLDNMPIVLLPKFLELRLSSAREIQKVAVVIDIRGGEFLKEAPKIIRELKDAGYPIEIIYLECSDEVLLRRYSETRRQHPLVKEESIAQGIQKEREMLIDLKREADKVIDTSPYNVHQLRDVIIKYFANASAKRKINIYLQSFGYKYGIPSTSDLVIDVRFLPNPYFVEELKGRTGIDPEVAHFVMNRKETREFLKRFFKLIEFLLPLYEKEGKSYLTISIGCTGGRHRSVAIVEEIKNHLDRGQYVVITNHRDIQKE
jgi:UPF0042 nucleotide-binding protein